MTNDAALFEMRCYQVDDAGQLYISPVLKEWSSVSALGIDTVIDMEGGLDEWIPTAPNECLYLYFPIEDADLPNLTRLDAVGDFGARLISGGHRILSHCGMGFNRSALVAGVILHKLGMTGSQAVERIRARRPGALFNEVFAEYLASLPGALSDARVRRAP
ncbi:MAG TPA: dual specificity protein phosphatase [Terriglobia bacterium]|nr:dual specificity protein phosphatase [Terriglobia bacterium]